MSLFDLPVEIVECIIQSLNGDRRSLANCSATCHAMLTLCRPSLWSTIVLSYEADSNPRIQDALVSFGILDINPQIASYVLSLTLKMTPNKRIIWSLRGDVIVKLVRGVCGRTPNLRFLKLQGLYVTNFLNLVALAADIPTLETLVLERILMEGAWVYDEQKQHMAPDWLELPASEALAAITIRQGWNLKSLQIGGRSDLYLPPATSYASLARFLAQSADSVSLESLSVRSRYAQAFFLPLLREPSALVAPFGAVLRHLSTSIRDMTVFGDVDPAGRNDIIELFEALPCCRQLRSLSICYSARGVQGGPTPTGWGRPPVFPFFLDALARTLGYRTPPPTASDPAPVPFPHFQHLTVEFTARADRVQSCAAAYARLASVLTGTQHTGLPEPAPDGGGGGGPTDAPGRASARRYPAFSTMTVRARGTVERAGAVRVAVELLSEA